MHTVTNLDVAAKALEWEGTPFVLAQSVKDVGCDCKGLIYGVGHELRLPEAECGIGPFRNYNVPNYDMLLEGLKSTLIQRQRAEGWYIGDVVLLRIHGLAQHMGLVLSERKMIHCYSAHPAKVLKSTFTPANIWGRSVHSVWKWPSVQYVTDPIKGDTHER